jgi:hypothetical protein
MVSVRRRKRSRLVAFTGRRKQFMSEKIQFQTNIPVEVALKYADGKDVTGDYGDQVLYSLTDGRVMYVPPIVKKQIQDLDIAKGELFTITKAEEKSGTRRTVKWLVTANGNATSQRRTSGAAGAPAPTNGNGHKPPFTGEPKGFLVTGRGNSCCRLSPRPWMWLPRRSATLRSASWSFGSLPRTCGRSD